MKKSFFLWAMLCIAFINATIAQCDLSPSFILNGSDEDFVEYYYGDPIIMDASATQSENSYFISIQKEDANWNTYGTEYYKWFNGEAPNHIDLNAFLKSKSGQNFHPGTRYRIKLAVKNSCTGWLEANMRVIIRCDAFTQFYHKGNDEWGQYLYESDLPLKLDASESRGEVRYYFGISEKRVVDDEPGPAFDGWIDGCAPDNIDVTAISGITPRPGHVYHCKIATQNTNTPIPGGCTNWNEKSIHFYYPCIPEDGTFREGCSEYSGEWTYIPDPKFEQALIDQNKTSGPVDGWVYTPDISDEISLHVYGKGINDLTGIEDFTSLKQLYAWENNLTELDLSQNTLLQGIYVANNDLTELTLGEKPNLYKIHAYSNQLTDLDISKCPKLHELKCFSNQLANITIGDITTLKTLELHNNNLTEINLGNQTGLKKLFLQRNNLLTINVKNGNNSNMSDLNFRIFENINLTCVEVDDSQWSMNNWTTYVDNNEVFLGGCYTRIPDPVFEQVLNDKHTSGPIDGWVFTSEISGLTKLNIDNKGITDLTGIEDITALEVLYCFQNPGLKSLDLSKNKNLLTLYAWNCDLRTLDLSQLIKLKTAYVANNRQLTSLTLGNKPDLTILHCYNDDLTELNLSRCFSLYELKCFNNRLNSIIFASTRSLQILEAQNNQLVNVNLNFQENLNKIYLQNNDLETLTMRYFDNEVITDVNFRTFGNPELKCIEVDKPAYSETTWTTYTDEDQGFSRFCEYGPDFLINGSGEYHQNICMGTPVIFDGSLSTGSDGYRIEIIEYRNDSYTKIASESFSGRVSSHINLNEFIIKHTGEDFKYGLDYRVYLSFAVKGVQNGKSLKFTILEKAFPDFSIQNLVNVGGQNVVCDLEVIMDAATTTGEHKYTVSLAENDNVYATQDFENMEIGDGFNLSAFAASFGKNKLPPSTVTLTAYGCEGPKEKSQYFNPAGKGDPEFSLYPSRVVSDHYNFCGPSEVILRRLFYSDEISHTISIYKEGVLEFSKSQSEGTPETINIDDFLYENTGNRLLFNTTYEVRLSTVGCEGTNVSSKTFHIYGDPTPTFTLNGSEETFQSICSGNEIIVNTSNIINEYETIITLRKPSPSGGNLVWPKTIYGDIGESLDLKEFFGSFLEVGYKYNISIRVWKCGGSEEQSMSFDYKEENQADFSINGNSDLVQTHCLHDQLILDGSSSINEYAYTLSVYKENTLLHSRDYIGEVPDAINLNNFIKYWPAYENFSANTQYQIKLEVIGCNGLSEKTVEMNIGSYRLSTDFYFNNNPDNYQEFNKDDMIYFQRDYSYLEKGILISIQEEAEDGTLKGNAYEIYLDQLSSSVGYSLNNLYPVEFTPNQLFRVTATFFGKGCDDQLEIVKRFKIKCETAANFYLQSYPYATGTDPLIIQDPGVYVDVELDASANKGENNYCISVTEKNSNNTLISSYYNCFDGKSTDDIVMDKLTDIIPKQGHSYVYTLTSNYTSETCNATSEKSLELILPCENGYGPCVDVNEVYTYIPDDKFEAYLIDVHNVSGPMDNYVLTSEIENIEILDLREPYAAKILTGVEDFINLKMLQVDDCHKHFDLSNNFYLESLSIGKFYYPNSTFTKLDLSKNTNLQSLYLKYCPLLTAIDLSNNTKLKNLSLTGPGIDEIDLSKLLELENLGLYNNSFTSVDLRNNNKIKELRFSNTQIRSLDTRNLTDLKTLYLYNTSITALNLVKNKQLQYLRSSFNDLKYLNLKNGNNEILTRFYVKDSPLLSCIQTDGIQSWKDANLVNIDPGVSFDCDQVIYTYVPDDNFEQYFDGDNEILDDLVLTNTLESRLKIEAPDRGIKDLTGIEACNALTELKISNNAIKSLDLSANQNLNKLLCSNNGLEKLIGLEGNSSLEYLTCSNNELESLDISNCSSLINLVCSSNNLTDLKLQNNFALTYFDCDYNFLETIETESLISLTGFGCYGNLFTTLDFSQSHDLETLIAMDNPLLTHIVLTDNYQSQFALALSGSYNVQCIDVFNVQEVIENPAWTYFNPALEPLFSENCGTSTKNGNNIYSHLEIYPNPVSIDLFIETSEAVNYELINVSGNTVKTGTLEAGLSTLDVSLYPDGVYFLKLEGANIQEVEKVVIQK